MIEKLESIGHWVADSEYFGHPHFGYVVSSVRYSAQRYIDALQSYSPYLKLNDSVKNALFQALMEMIKAKHGGAIDLWYVTGYHIAKKA